MCTRLVLRRPRAEGDPLGGGGRGGVQACRAGPAGARARCSLVTAAARAAAAAWGCDGRGGGAVQQLAVQQLMSSKADRADILEMKESVRERRCPLSTACDV